MSIHDRQAAEQETCTHTPEPWTQDHYGHIYGGDGVRLLVSGVAMPCGVHREADLADGNARRIVAAVNAVAGIPTEALESGALRDLLVTLRQIARMEELPIGDQHEEMSSRVGAARMAKAVLAKVRPAEGPTR